LRRRPAVARERVVPPVLRERVVPLVARAPVLLPAFLRGVARPPDLPAVRLVVRPVVRFAVRLLARLLVRLVVRLVVRPPAFVVLRPPRERVVFFAADRRPPRFVPPPSCLFTVA